MCYHKTSRTPSYWSEGREGNLRRMPAHTHTTHTHTHAHNTHTTNTHKQHTHHTHTTHTHIQLSIVPGSPFWRLYPSHLPTEAPTVSGNFVKHTHTHHRHHTHVSHTILTCPELVMAIVRLYCSWQHVAEVYFTTVSRLVAKCRTQQPPHYT